MKDIITLGEVLIDLTQTGTDENGIPQFAAFPGGAPANVAVAAARLGARTGFIGKVGRDSFGEGLVGTLDKEGVATAFLTETDESPTTLAIVHVDETGERSFAFYRQPGADTRLTAEDATAFLRDAADRPLILHFGSLSLTTEPSRGAAMTAVGRAKAGGILISYDPNYRPALWTDETAAVERMKEPLDLVDILKVSDEELVLLTGTSDLEEGSRILAEHGIALILVTLGSEGVFYRFGGSTGSIPGVQVKVSDTNGAGDTFLGAMLMQISRAVRGNACPGSSGTGSSDEPAAVRNTAEAEAIKTEEAANMLTNVMDEGTLRKFLEFANRAAAMTCSRPGAIPAMPTLEELERE